MLTENAEGKREFYGLGKKCKDFDNGLIDGGENVTVNHFGPNAKPIVDNFVYLLTDVDAELVQSFACTYSACFFVMKKWTKKPVSIIPDKPEAEGEVDFARSEFRDLFRADFLLG